MHVNLTVPFQNQRLIEQNELLRKHSSNLEKKNASLSCHHSLASQPTVPTAGVNDERMNLIGPDPGIDEHWFPHDQPPPVTTAIHPPAALPLVPLSPPEVPLSPPEVPLSPLAASLAGSCEDKVVAAGPTKSAALGCVSLQQKRLALLRSFRPSSWTASVKVSLLAKVIILMM